jgi:Rieske Fe-S protein
VADHDGTTRGQFLSLSTVGLGAMIGGVIGVPATAYILAPVTKKINFEPVFLGTVDRFPSEGGQFKPIAATYVEDPKNPDTSPGLAWVHNTGKQGTTWDAADAMFIVFSNRCMHLGCPVAASLSGFACPCHGGQYNQEGQRIAGPPIRPLDRFQWELRKSKELWITQRWSVDFNSSGQIHYYDVKGPGQPVTLPFGGSTVANVLYPNVTYNYPAGK